jgi:Ni,Fe-hydrogenase III component G
MNRIVNQKISPEHWTEFNLSLKARGSHLSALTAFSDERLEVSWLVQGSVLIATLDSSASQFPSLAAALPEVAWDEREIHDLFGYLPLDHPDLRPLVRTPRWPADFYPLAAPKVLAPSWQDVQPKNPIRIVDGEGVTVMKVGPTHAGIIESGHFVFSLIGENILDVDLHLFQNHRGVEAALQDRGTNPGGGDY